MTVIAGIKTPHGVYLASDSLASSASSKTDAINPKVFQVGPYGVAFCGSYRFGQILQSFVPPTRAPEQNPEDFMVLDWVDSLRDHLRFKGHLMKVNEMESCPDTEAIIAYEGGLYIFQEDLAVYRPGTSYHAAGSGGEYALGALHALNGRVKDPQTLLKAAIKAASDHCPSCGGPVHFLKLAKGRV